MFISVVFTQLLPRTPNHFPLPRHWTRDRDFGPATRDPRLLVKLLRYRQVVTCLILFKNNLFMDFVHFRCTCFVLEATVFCLVITMFVYTEIFFTLRHNQIQVQNHVVQAQQSQVIPLNIARYRKAVNSALWVRETLVVLLSALWYSSSFNG